ncbi:MAG: alpha/beta fold hydrolase [Candidatus Sumerlaeaceae bacterium]
MKLSCVCKGPASSTGAPLVLLHAYPLDSRMWRSQVEHFSGSRRVAALDFRGYGKSTDYGNDPFSMSVYAQDVLETLDGLGIQKAVIAGCSMGGYTIFELWRRAPERFAAMILCDTRADADDEAGREKRMQQIRIVQQKGTGFLPGFVEENQMSPHTREQNRALVDEVKGWAAGATAGAVVRTIQMLADRPDSISTLGTVSVPTLVVVGEDDKVTPVGMAHVIAEGIRGARLETVPKAGHLSPLENPGAVNVAMAELLGRV